MTTAIGYLRVSTVLRAVALGLVVVGCSTPATTAPLPAVGPGDCPYWQVAVDSAGEPVCLTNIPEPTPDTRDLLTQYNDCLIAEREPKPTGGAIRSLLGTSCDEQFPALAPWPRR